MKKIKNKIFLFVAFLAAINSSAQIPGNTQESLTAPADTVITRVDTIVVKELVERTDIIIRTEKILNHSETLKNQNDSGVVQKPVQINEDPSENSSLSPQLKEKEGGHYVWIPDSMQNKMNDVLSGSLSPEWLVARRDSDRPFDPNEKVLFRGDTIPMVLRSRNLGRYDRGLFNFLFIPKGIWQVGITASYGEFSTENLEVLDLISDIDFYGHIFSVKPYFAYFIKNNISLGMRLGYTAGTAKIGSFKVDIDEDMNFNLHDIMYKSRSYSASFLLTQYLGLARRGRIGIFNEVEFAMSGGNSDFNRPFNGEMRETHTTTVQAALNFSPGLCVYVLDRVSFNVSFGVFGLYLKNEKQKVNGIPEGERTTSGANFRFNIFNINFGLAVNI